jgi:TRIAD3 protein (E3 ubiquitin-protein ligase RNF216)
LVKKQSWFKQLIILFLIQCDEESHIPLKCSEVEKKTDTSDRVKLEEAMTKARVRQCPSEKCKTRFYKIEGCNKMTCSCGIHVCYICR